MVNNMTVVILLIAISVVPAMLIGSPALKTAEKLASDSESNVKVGYIIDGNKLTILQITGNKDIPIPPGTITINSADDQAPVGANIAWKRGKTIEAGTSITNNINKEINLKMFFKNKPIIDAVLEAGYNTLGNMNQNNFGNGTCDGCVASNTITFS